MGEVPTTHLQTLLAHEPIIGVYAGSFDPITRGHMGVICEAVNTLDELIVGVTQNPDKGGGMFAIEDRVRLVKEAIEDFKSEIEDKISKEKEISPSEKEAIARLKDGRCKLTVEGFDGLTFDFAMQHGAHQLIRGVRPVGDHESEQTLANMNRLLANARGYNETTVFVPTADTRYIFASSSAIRTFVKEGEHAAISGLLYPSTIRAVEQRVREDTARRRIASSSEGPVRGA